MKFISKLGRVAASQGDTPEQQNARRVVASEFLEEHVYKAGGPWEEVRRALQCMDVSQPVLVGPPPANSKSFPLPPSMIAGTVISGEMRMTSSPSPDEMLMEATAA